MLEPDGRIHLREALRPPPGFALSRAIATTFTLDLTAALVAPLAFAAHEIDQDKDPVAVMEAIRSVTERVDIFCQAGNIAVPHAASDLMAFLEPMVHELPRPRSGHLFHPKVWLLRFVASDGTTEYRLVCGSRNLTMDTAWDAAVTLDGSAGTRPLASNRPIVDFVSYLVDRAPRLPAQRAAAIRDLADELRRVEWSPPEQVNEMAFHALGLTARASNDMDFSGTRHLIISPFLNDVGVQTMTVGSKEAIVVSRPESLECLDPATLQNLARTYCVSSMAELGDLDDLSKTGRANLHGLHAKVVVAEWDRKAHLFIGSANATDAALGGNVEFVVELIAGRKFLGIDAMLGDEAGFRTILEPYVATGGETATPSEELERALENFLRMVAEREFAVRPTADDVGTFDLRLTGPAQSIEDGWTVTFAPLTHPNSSIAASDSEPIDLRFSKLQLADVGPFVIVRVGAQASERSTVIRAVLVDDPPERLDAILARQVDTPEKLMRFLMLVLGMGAFDIEMLPASSGVNATWAFGSGTSALFELIVRATAERPDALLEIDRLLTRMQRTEQGRAILPDGLTALWEAVRPLLPASVETHR